ncbi:MAG: hypothetical protein LBH38_03370 [Holosporales bacterium]|jgi:F-type H+-transporting ATPase subunit epsilon|nr:hypothetical protein [Holosporales bacterium]
MENAQTVGAAGLREVNNTSDLSFKVMILAPDGILWIGTAEMVIAPGAIGEFTVLSKHIPMISLLSEGSLRIFEKKASAACQTVDVTHGICSILPDEVVVLTDLHYTEKSLNAE